MANVNKEILLERLNKIINKSHIDVSDIVLHKTVTCEERVVIDINQIKRDIQKVIDRLKVSDVIEYPSDRDISILFSNNIPIKMIDFLGTEREATVYLDFFLLGTSEYYNNSAKSIIEKFLSIKSSTNKYQALKSLNVSNSKEVVTVTTLEELDKLIGERDFILNVEDKYYIVYKDNVEEVTYAYYADNQNTDLSPINPQVICNLLN